MVPPVLQQLGALGVRRFLREYWQRRPLLVRQAVPGLAAPLTRDELFVLAGREDVASPENADGRDLLHAPRGWPRFLAPMANRWRSRNFRISLEAR